VWVGAGGDWRLATGDWVSLESAYNIWQWQSCTACSPTREFWVGVVKGV